MRDLAPLNPNWDDPEPVDGPDPEERVAVQALAQLHRRLTTWLQTAATSSLPPVQWRDLGAVLDAVRDTVAAADTDHIAVYTPARVDLYPHPAVPLDGQCARCHRAIDDQVHPTAIDNNEGLPHEQ
jgi:hypothetical protein